MNKRIKEKWINALLSGDYDQTTKMLRSDQDKFCCLGVLCDIAPKTKGSWSELDHGGFAFLNSRDLLPDSVVDILPDSVVEWAGLEDPSPMVELDVVQTLFPEKNLEEIVVIPGYRKTTALASLNDNGFTFEEIAKIIQECL